MWQRWLSTGRVGRDVERPCIPSTGLSPEWGLGRVCAWVLQATAGRKHSKLHQECKQLTEMFQVPAAADSGDNLPQVRAAPLPPASTQTSTASAARADGGAFTKGGGASISIPSGVFQHILLCREDVGVELKN